MSDKKSNEQIKASIALSDVVINKEYFQKVGIKSVDPKHPIDTQLTIFVAAMRENMPITGIDLPSFLRIIDPMQDAENQIATWWFYQTLKHQPPSEKTIAEAVEEYLHYNWDIWEESFYTDEESYIQPKEDK